MNYRKASTYGITPGRMPPPDWGYAELLVDDGKSLLPGMERPAKPPQSRRV